MEHVRSAVHVAIYDPFRHNQEVRIDFPHLLMEIVQELHGTLFTNDRRDRMAMVRTVAEMRTLSVRELVIQESVRSETMGHLRKTQQFIAPNFAVKTGRSMDPRRNIVVLDPFLEIITSVRFDGRNEPTRVRPELRPVLIDQLAVEIHDSFFAPLMNPPDRLPETVLSSHKGIGNILGIEPVMASDRPSEERNNIDSPLLCQVQKRRSHLGIGPENLVVLLLEDCQEPPGSTGNPFRLFRKIPDAAEPIPVGFRSFFPGTLLSGDQGCRADIRLTRETGKMVHKTESEFIDPGKILEDKLLPPEFRVVARQIQIPSLSGQFRPLHGPGFRRIIKGCDQAMVFLILLPALSPSRSGEVVPYSLSLWDQQVHRLRIRFETVNHRTGQTENDKTFFPVYQRGGDLQRILRRSIGESQINGPPPCVFIDDVDAFSVPDDPGRSLIL